MYIWYVLYYNVYFTTILVLILWWLTHMKRIYSIQLLGERERETSNDVLDNITIIPLNDFIF